MFDQGPVLELGDGIVQFYGRKDDGKQWFQLWLAGFMLGLPHDLAQ
jgi:hypothetical protein